MSRTANDIWIEILRDIERYSRDAKNTLGEVDYSFMVFPESGGVKNFFTNENRGPDHLEQVAAFIGMVGRGMSAHGFAMVGEGSMKLGPLGEDLKGKPLPDEQLWSADNSRDHHVLVSLVVFHDESENRQMISRCVPITHRPDKTLSYGRPIVTHGADNILIFGKTIIDVLPEKRLDMTATISCGLWAIEKSHKMMKKLGVFMLDRSPAAG